MVKNELIATIEAIAKPGKGILAADESTNTIAKRLNSIHVESTFETRLAYREMLFTTEGLENYINGVILFEETLSQKNAAGKTLAEILSDKGIIPGIKVDKGLVTLENTHGEKVTQGLDGLDARLKEFKEMGARFAKWRNVYAISQDTPSRLAIQVNAQNLARYAACCQAKGIVPIVEPEVLIDGDHSIETSYQVQKRVLQALFNALHMHKVSLEHIILKPSMVIAGKDCQTQSSAQEVAEYTVRVFKEHVPAAVPTINFLSGGQTPEQATENLHAINSIANRPWNLSFSYGRALQEPSLNAWQGKAENVATAQEALLKRSRLNAAASVGEYQTSMEG